MAISLIDLSKHAPGRLQLPRRSRWFVRPGDSALLAMIDFRERAVVTVEATRNVEGAADRMRLADIRSAFVVEAATRRVCGFITAFDCVGDRLRDRARELAIPRVDLVVRDLMTPVERWYVAKLGEVERSTVAEVAEALRLQGLTHLPVIETLEWGERCIRGIFSAAHVRLLMALGLRSDSEEARAAAVLQGSARPDSDARILS